MWFGTTTRSRLIWFTCDTRSQGSPLLKSAPCRLVRRHGPPPAALCAVRGRPLPPCAPSGAAPCRYRSPPANLVRCHGPPPAALCAVTGRPLPPCAPSGAAPCRLVRRQGPPPAATGRPLPTLCDVTGRPLPPCAPSRAAPCRLVRQERKILLAGSRFSSALNGGASSRLDSESGTDLIKWPLFDVFPIADPFRCRVISFSHKAAGRGTGLQKGTSWTPGNQLGGSS